MRKVSSFLIWREEPKSVLLADGEPILVTSHLLEVAYKIVSNVVLGRLRPIKESLNHES